MFNNISDILKSFTPAQRITALLILVFTIVLISLGPSLIDRHTTDCSELEIRVKSQQTQIMELSAQVEKLNRDLISGQSECTANLIQKQQEIMNIVNGMIEEAQCSVKPTVRRREQMMRTGPDQGSGAGDGELAYSRAPEPQPVRVIDETLPKLKQLKAQIQKTMRSK
jgi:hypothetical protein